MPHKRLPKELVSKIKNIQNKRISQKRTNDFRRFFLRLKNSDHRKVSKDNFKDFLKEFEKCEEFAWVGLGCGSGTHKRVRQLDVSRQFPEVGKVVIKKIDFGDKGMLKQYLKKFNTGRVSEVIIKKPKIYFLKDDLILMAKTNYPSLIEIFGDSQKNGITKRGIKLLNDSLKKSVLSKDFVEKQMHEFCMKYKVANRNVLFLGIKNKKIILMPLPDIN